MSATVEFAVRDAFGQGVWDRHCLAVARRHLASWEADLPDGATLSVADSDAFVPTVIVRGSGPVSIGVALEDAQPWWPRYASWDAGEWRDLLLLQALQPVLDAIGPWFPASGVLTCDWSGTFEAPRSAAALQLDWTAPSDERRIALYWDCAHRAVEDWRRGQDPDADDEGWDDEAADGLSASVPGGTAVVRPLTARLDLSPRDLGRLAVGCGLLVDPAPQAPMPLWVKVRDDWALLGRCRQDSEGEDAEFEIESAIDGLPELRLPPAATDGSLHVLGPEMHITPAGMTAADPLRAESSDSGCELRIGPRLAGRGRMRTWQGARVVQVTEWIA